MNTKLKNTLLGSLVGAAVGVSIALTYQAQTADVEPAPPPKVSGVVIELPNDAKAEQRLKFSTVKDSAAPRAAMSIERNGAEVMTITIYAPTGERALVVHPDGNVEVLKGTPDEAARLFWAVVAKQLGECHPAKP